MQDEPTWKLTISDKKNHGSKTATLRKWNKNIGHGSYTKLVTGSVSENPNKLQNVSISYLHGLKGSVILVACGAFSHMRWPCVCMLECAKHSNCWNFSFQESEHKSELLLRLVARVATEKKNQMLKISEWISWRLDAWRDPNAPSSFGAVQDVRKILDHFGSLFGGKAKCWRWIEFSSCPFHLIVKDCWKDLFKNADWTFQKKTQNQTCQSIYLFPRWCRHVAMGAACSRRRRSECCDRPVPAMSSRGQQINDSWLLAVQEEKWQRDSCGRK